MGLLCAIHLGAIWADLAQQQHGKKHSRGIESHCPSSQFLYIHEQRICRLEYYYGACVAILLEMIHPNRISLGGG